ncbi:MAG TPA: hypothetical protein VNL16_13695 [Chloroflexota bacterium]|nr:hypothetical protein [Chloroflexota bacterium]
MAWNRLTGQANGLIRDVAWWATISPFCVGTNLPRLESSAVERLHLAGETDQYPTTELLGRLWAFRGRLRFARALLIVPRSMVLCAVILLLARSIQVMIQRPMSGWLPLVLFVVLGWGLHLAFHHEIPSFEVARLVDRRAGLQAQLATAVEYTASRRMDEPLVKTQVRLATSRLRDLDPRQVVPLVWPSTDLRLFVLVAALYGAVSFVGTLGLSLPRPPQAIDAELTKLAQQDAQAPSAYVTMDPGQIQQQQAIATSNDQMFPRLKTLQQQLAAKSITPQEYQAQLQQMQQQIQAEATQSLAAQQALNALAAALKDSSTTHAISDSLAQGDYSQAASQLSDLSQQLDKLSPEAQSELASRLSQAATETQQSNQAMSQSAQQSSDALKQGDTAQASQSLQALSQAVQQASGQIASQAQLGQSLQQIQQGLGNQQSASNSSSSPSGDNASALVTPGASQQSQQAQGAQQGGAQGNLDQSVANAGSSAEVGSGASAGGQPGAEQQIQQGQLSNAGGAGDGPGSDLLNAQPVPLDVGGVKLTITGQASANGDNQTKPGDRTTPLTGADGSTISAAGGSAPASSNTPINVHQESNVVPLELKPVVREYFSNAGS